MANWNGYIGVEDLGMTQQQRDTLRTAFEGLGALNQSPYPHQRNHWRPSLDGSKIIFEAVFDENNMTISAVKGFLATAFGVDPGDISNAGSSQTFAILSSPIQTFTYNAVDRLRFIIFGGLVATLAESRIEVKAYIAANSSEWNEPNP